LPARRAQGKHVLVIHRQLTLADTRAANAQNKGNPVVRIPIFIASAIGLVAMSPASAQLAPASSQSPDSIPATRAEVIKVLDARFAKIDANGDGGLTAAELQTLEAQVIASQKAEIASAVQRAFAKLDTNKDGRLSIEEYSAAAPKIDANASDNAAELVRMLDTDKNGKISSTEFKRRTLAGFDKLDTNKDSTVTPEERSKAVVDTAGR
jgi:Ca2+-binding EF-hand superfamily protein